MRAIQSDHSGKLGYDEFKHLWAGLRHWKVWDTL